MSFFLGPNIALTVVLTSFLVLGIVIFGVRTSIKTKFSIISLFLALSIVMTLVSCSDWNSLQSHQMIYAKATSGSLTFYDPLDGKNEDGWNMGYQICQYKEGAYYATTDITEGNYDPYYEYCWNENTDFGNFAYQVRMEIIQGDQGCIVFRQIVVSDTDKNNIFCIGSDGSYVFVETTGDQVDGSSAAINSGLGQVNYVTVVAQRTEFTMFVNAKFVVAVQDDTSPSKGSIGIGGLSKENATEVAFNYAQVWAL